jgi:hypothetical protein
MPAHINLIENIRPVGQASFYPPGQQKKRKINFMDKMTEGYKDEKISCVAASCSNVFSRKGDAGKILRHKSHR